jgi:hypothetical protein
MAGHFGYIHVAMAVAGLVIGAGLMMFLPITTSYDGCMLQMMRGQPQTSISHALTLCRKRHPTS